MRGREKRSPATPVLARRRREALCLAVAALLVPCAGCTRRSETPTTRDGDGIREDGGEQSRSPPADADLTGRPAMFHLVYEIDFDAAEAEPAEAQPTRDRSEVVPAVLRSVRERLDGLGMEDVSVRAESGTILVDGILRNETDVVRVKAALDVPPTLEFRIVSEEGYVDSAVTDFLERETRFAGRVAPFEAEGHRHLEVVERDADDGKELLQAFVESYRSQAEARGDAATGAVWKRVLVGSDDAPATGRADDAAARGLTPTR